jgi:hypothetical protein
MKKSFLMFLMLIVVVLAGCIPSEQATPTTTSMLITTAATQVKSTPTLVLTVPTQSTFLPEPGCTVVSRKPTPGPTEETIYSPISLSDHVKGPESAKVTIIEYSDFQ